MAMSLDTQSGDRSTQELERSAASGSGAWRRLGLRLRSVTPTQLARFVLVLLAVALVSWIVLSAWLSLLPFEVGLLLAYLVLPIVDVLDRVMPRWVAALVVTIGEIALILGAIGLLVPPLVAEVPQLILGLPGADAITALLDQLRGALTQLPPGVQDTVRTALTQASASLQSNLLDLVRGLLLVAAASILGLLSTLGFVLSFVAIPTWLLALISDRKGGRRAVDRILPSSVRPDFWAIVRAFDRTFGSYLRGQILRALIFGAGLYTAFAILNHQGLTDLRYPLSVTVFAVLAYLVPDIGPIVGALPAVLAALARSPREGAIVLIAYVAVAALEQHLVAPRIEERSIDVPAVVLVPLIVALSQFGIIWVLLAAPLIVVVRDVFGYVYGRLGTPPAPAGVLPGEQPSPPPITLANARRRA
jgi:predicted PurR-regulated permease PerM